MTALTPFLWPLVTPSSQVGLPQSGARIEKQITPSHSALGWHTRPRPELSVGSGGLECAVCPTNPLQPLGAWEGGQERPWEPLLHRAGLQLVPVCETTGPGLWIAGWFR